jgi:hypothetical protein
MAVLPTPGLADEHGVVLGAAAEHLLHALDLVAAAHERVERVLHRGLGEVAAELGEQRRFLAARQRGLLVEELDDVLPHGVQAHPLLHQDRRGHRALLAQDAEQHVLGADVVVEQAVGFFGGALQHPLGLGAERHLHRRGDLFPEHRSGLRSLFGCFSRDRWERAKIRLVSPFPSRIRPSRRCSVSIDMLPSWLAS